MSELTVSLAAQRTPFMAAYHAVHQYYGVSITQFAVIWNWAKSL